jgi:hypothetical protein
VFGQPFWPYLDASPEISAAFDQAMAADSSHSYWSAIADGFAPEHRYYAAVKDRKNSKRACLSEARKILRQAHHILAELGDDALAAA